MNTAREAPTRALLEGFPEMSFGAQAPCRARVVSFKQPRSAREVSAPRIAPRVAFTSLEAPGGHGWPESGCHTADLRVLPRRLSSHPFEDGGQAGTALRGLAADFLERRAAGMCPRQRVPVLNTGMKCKAPIAPKAGDTTKASTTAGSSAVTTVVTKAKATVVITGDTTAETTVVTTGDATAETTVVTTGDATAGTTTEATVVSTGDTTTETTVVTTSDTTAETTVDATAEISVVTTGDTTAETTVVTTFDTTAVVSTTGSSAATTAPQFPPNLPPQHAYSANAVCVLFVCCLPLIVLSVCAFCFLIPKACGVLPEGVQ
ncbi:hypothetical protein NDU88_007452 [Pleurodeles waltl]|uniref:Uncharacterized protein n=1 Tax=Pleurodeles waltl TaxID=8319 RepID=A0AAV7SSF8_PLEWA|nr:hypothetical protein NDU88_007452 [Pleurodeles waltl]